MDFPERITTLVTCADKLINLLKDKDWFHSVILEKARLVVQVHYMNLEVLTTIPSTLEGQQILVHFAPPEPNSRITIIEPIFVDDTSTDMLDDSDLIIEDFGEEPLKPVGSWFSPTDKEDDDWDINNLIRDIAFLTKENGYKIIKDLFFEVHDGPVNSVTCRAAFYPEAFSKLTQLYQDFGYDLMYEELEKYPNEI